MWSKFLIELIASNLTKEVVAILLDKIADSLENRLTHIDIMDIKRKL